MDRPCWPLAWSLPWHVGFVFTHTTRNVLISCRTAAVAAAAPTINYFVPTIGYIAEFQDEQTACSAFLGLYMALGVQDY